MADNPAQHSAKEVNRKATDGKLDTKPQGDGHPKDTAYNNMYREVEAAMAGGAAGAVAGEIASMAAKHPSSKSEQKDANSSEKSKELAKEKAGPLPNFEVTNHALDAKTQHAVDDAAKQIANSDGKNHKLADAAMKHAYLTDDKGVKGDHYNQVYKALSDGVANLHKGGDGVISKIQDFGHGRVSAQVLEHGRNAPTAHESSLNYYKNAQQGSFAVGDAKR